MAVDRQPVEAESRWWWWDSPTALPTLRPSPLPTFTHMPTVLITMTPSRWPSVGPSRLPTVLPTTKPTIEPSAWPSRSPTYCPSARPTCEPSVVPTHMPSVMPSDGPSVSPSPYPTTFPPTSAPTITPSFSPSAVPTVIPTAFPTAFPTIIPSANPTASPTIFVRNPGTMQYIDDAALLTCSVLLVFLFFCGWSRFLKWDYTLRGYTRVPDGPVSVVRDSAAGSSHQIIELGSGYASEASRSVGHQQTVRLNPGVPGPSPLMGCNDPDPLKNLRSCDSTMQERDGITDTTESTTKNYQGSRIVNHKPEDEEVQQSSAPAPFVTGHSPSPQAHENQGRNEASANRTTSSSLTATSQTNTALGWAQPTSVQQSSTISDVPRQLQQKGSQSQPSLG
jgi:hypothetical protein